MRDRILMPFFVKLTAKCLQRSKAFLLCLLTVGSLEWTEVGPMLCCDPCWGGHPCRWGGATELCPQSHSFWSQPQLDLWWFLFPKHSLLPYTQPLVCTRVLHFRIFAQHWSFLWTNKLVIPRQFFSPSLPLLDLLNFLLLATTESVRLKSHLS